MADINPQEAISFIYNNAPKYAKAKADRVFIEEFRKSKKAILFQQATSGPIAERESFAYAHEEYQDLLKGLQAAVEIEETLRWQIEAARLKTEIWRTTQANNRAIDGATR
jgi:hypothetical protein